MALQSALAALPDNENLPPTMRWATRMAADAGGLICADAIACTL
ncbi:hypothetical protein ABZ297_30935 [Nonomuraea sp. NPDC005983]